MALVSTVHVYVVLGYKLFFSIKVFIEGFFCIWTFVHVIDVLKALLRFCSVTGGL